jgi:hypothetical protein
MIDTNQTPPGRPGLFDVQGFVRKFIPFGQGKIVNGQHSGPGQYLICAFAAPNSDTTFAHTCGRVPNNVISTFIPSGGGAVTAGGSGKAAWTVNSIILRAPAAGTYTVWIS